MKASERSPLRRYFAGLAEYVFHTHLGIADTTLIDYLTDLLDRFVRSDAIFGLRDTQGRRLDQVIDMLIEAEARIGEARRQAHRHIGDFTLFWVGVYPEGLRRLRGPMRKDAVVDYPAFGKHSYREAAEIETHDEPIPPAPVLDRLSREFETCARGLHEVRLQWERERGDESVPPFLIN